MRVLFWTLNFWPNIGGVEVLAAKLLPALRERGHEFLVMAPKSPPELPHEAQYQGVAIRRFAFQNTTTTADIDHLVEIRQEVAKHKRAFAPDLIHINGVGPADFFHLTTRRAHPAPLVVTLHAEWQQQADTIVGQTLRAADWVAGCSAAVLDRGRRLAPEIVPRSSVIYNGMDTPALAPAPLPFDPPHILYLGRLSPEKGMDLALAAFVNVVSRFPSARLIIAGDGPSRWELKRQADGLGIDHAVDFCGWVAPNKVPSLINTSTIVLMPSRQDSLPLVALEAALMARPIIATRVGGLPEVVAHGETGLLVESENSAALADAVAFLLSHPKMTIQLGRAGRTMSQTVFNWERHVESYDTLYRKVIEQDGVGRVG